MGVKYSAHQRIRKRGIDHFNRQESVELAAFQRGLQLIDNAAFGPTGKAMGILLGLAGVVLRNLSSPLF